VALEIRILIAITVQDGAFRASRFNKFLWNSPNFGRPTHAHSLTCSVTINAKAALHCSPGSSRAYSKDMTLVK
jgi:hypothetical protein